MKYEVRFCSCGHIHVFPFSLVEDAVKADEHLLLICADCGKASMIGADILEGGYYGDEEGKTCYSMYTSDFSKYDSKLITKNFFRRHKTHKALNKIYYSHGLEVPMMTGYKANYYYDGEFCDGSEPDWYEIDHTGDLSREEIMAFINKHRSNKWKVNMERFIRNNDEDKIRAISNYVVKGLDWRGTKFEYKPEGK